MGNTWRRMMRSGETPVRRAACTYSLCRSTSVEPRTVRAYCTQPVSEMDRISTPNTMADGALGNKARATPAISSAIKIVGKDNITSHTRMMNVSSLPPTKPATNPRLTPSSADSATDAKPTTSEMRAPNISADKMSRPWSSVPSAYLALPSVSHRGGKNASDNSRVARSNGLCGATQLAKIAQNRHTNATRPAAIANGEWRKL